VIAGWGRFAVGAGGGAAESAFRCDDQPDGDFRAAGRVIGVGVIENQADNSKKR